MVEPARTLAVACGLLAACSSTPQVSNGSSGGGGGAGDASSAGADMGGNAGAPSDSQCALAARGVAIYAAWDPLGYPLYALDGCNLVYVAPDGSLHLLDLASGEDQLLDGPENRPRRPSASSGIVAWEIQLDGQAQVRVRASSATTTLSGSFDHAAEPKSARDAIAFTAFAAKDPNSDTDVLLYDVATGNTRVALGGAGQQRFADISEDFVVASDFSEDPKGYFDESGSVADLVILSRADGTLTQRKKPGKQAFPMLGKGGLLAYLHWGEVHPEPKFSTFALFLGRTDSTPESDISIRDIHTDPSYVRPFVRGTVVDFVDSSVGSPTLYRLELSPLAEPVVATQASSSDWLLGPTGTEAWTVLGKRSAGDLVLDVWAR